MQTNQRIEIQLVDDRGSHIRLANVLPTITFFDHGRRHYVFDLRPTDSEGRTVADFNEIDMRRREAALTSLMDYNTLLTALDPTAEISVPSEVSLQQRFVAMNEWDHWTRPAWIFKWPVNGCLAPVEPTLVQFQGPVIRAEIVVSLPKEAP